MADYTTTSLGESKHRITAWNMEDFMEGVCDTLDKGFTYIKGTAQSIGAERFCDFKEPVEKPAAKKPAAKKPAKKKD